MRKRIAALLSAFALAVAGVAATSPAAQADTPGCVSDGEYNNTVGGEREVSVHNRYDTSGWLVDTTYSSGYRYQHRQYVRCPNDALSNRVNVEYRTPVMDGSPGYNRVVRKWRSTD